MSLYPDPGYPQCVFSLEIDISFTWEDSEVKVNVHVVTGGNASERLSILLVAFGVINNDRTLVWRNKYRYIFGINIKSGHNINLR